VGDLVVFDSPKLQAIDPLDRQRKLKMIAALPGDVVSVKDSALWINGRYWGRFWIAKWARTASPDTAAPWFVRSAPVDGAWTVPPGQALLLGTEPLSFDGRYWGFIDLKTIASRAVVL
jgi:conjugal transfer pilin signal peptidase TrbI